MSEIVQPQTIKSAELKLAAKKGLLIGAVRSLRLLERMPLTFFRRSWRQDGGRIELATVALCLMRLGGFAQLLKVPREWWDEEPWRFSGETEGSVTAATIVAHLDLKELLALP